MKLTVLFLYKIGLCNSSFKLPFILLLFLFIPELIFAQRTSIAGNVSIESGRGLNNITIHIDGSDFFAKTDSLGNYSFIGLREGRYNLVTKAMGYKPSQKEVQVIDGVTSVVNFILESNVEELEYVNVYGRTKVQEANKQPFNVTAIDATKLYNSTLNISNVMDRVSGVRVRESGGVGSDFNLSINGFSGKSIRYFIDGIPMDNFGSSFQINNIPVNLAERIEVYKGVVPIWLGADALGGAVNIITGSSKQNYIDASYSIGSFNTHRSVVNGAFTNKNGFTIQLNAYQNYSDNDYKVQVEASDINTNAYAPSAYLRRFHDNYHNEAVIVNVGMVGKSYADLLLLGMTVGQNYKEIQTGARMQAIYGQIHRRGNILMPSLKYRKTDLIEGLDVSLNANYNFGQEQYIDSVDVRYDWYGNSKPAGSSGERSKSHYKYRNNNGLLMATANYKIDDRQSIAVNNIFSTFNRKGSDIFNPIYGEYDNPRKTNKNILGMGYDYTVKDRWGATVFAKYFSQINVAGKNGSDKQDLQKLGYGAAVTYYINSNFQLKTSYENSNRLPEAFELFGDVENMQGNINIKPENSHNVNLGLIKDFAINDNNKFMVNANAIYRYATDFIFFRLNQTQNYLIADNREGVSTWGGDLEARYSYKKWLSAGTSMTYQYLRNLQKFDYDVNGNKMEIESPVYLDQMPNIPYLFGNADISATFPNVGGKKNTLNIGYNLLYVHKFWLVWPTYGGQNIADEKRFVPQQISHDLNMVYSMANGRYNVGLEIRNLTNNLLYDNFSLQKPTRGFYLNLRYFIYK